MGARRAIPGLLGALAAGLLIAPAWGAPGQPRAPAAAGKGPARSAPRWRPAAPRGHRDAIARWHTPTPGKTAPLDGAGRPMLVLHSINTGDSAEIQARTDDGGFDAAALEQASRVLRDQRTGLQYPVEPMTLDLVYQAQRRFKAHEIRVISAYRAPKARAVSNHGAGRAVDLVVPGATDKDVAEWAKGLGFVGVGIYPNAGYCHLDVRSRSRFWVDHSGPGQRGRDVEIDRERARKADEQARKQHRQPVGPHLLPGHDLEKSWGGAPAGAGEEHGPEDDHAD